MHLQPKMANKDLITINYDPMCPDCNNSCNAQYMGSW